MSVHDIDVDAIGPGLFRLGHLRISYPPAYGRGLRKGHGWLER